MQDRQRAQNPRSNKQTNIHFNLQTQLETTQMYLTTLKNTFVRNLQTVFDTKTKLYPKYQKNSNEFCTFAVVGQIGLSGQH